jgi:hypothetical protein
LPGNELRVGYRANQSHRRRLNKLLALLQSSEGDKFVAHLYQVRKHYRLICDRPNKGNKAIERNFIASYQIAQSLGFNGDLRATCCGFMSEEAKVQEPSQSCFTAAFVICSITKKGVLKNVQTNL